MAITKSTQAGISTMAIVKALHFMCYWPVSVGYMLPRLKDISDFSTTRLNQGPAPVHRLPLGALRGGTWDFSTVRLEPGDALVVYSDGLTEAQNERGEFFGDERLVRVVQTIDGEPQAAVDQIVEEVGIFVGEAEPYDDVTVVALRWVGET